MGIVDKGSKRRNLTAKNFENKRSNTDRKILYTDPKVMQSNRSGSKYDSVGPSFGSDLDSQSIFVADEKYKDFNCDTIDELGGNLLIRKKTNCLESGRLLINSATNVDEYITDKDIIKNTAFKLKRDRIRQMMECEKVDVDDLQNTNIKETDKAIMRIANKDHDLTESDVYNVKNCNMDK